MIAAAGTSGLGATLEALARSPLAIEAAARHEAARAETRRSILEAAGAAEAAARADERAAAAAVVAARSEVLRQRDALAAARTTLAAAEAAEAIAQTQAEQARNHADAALHELGNGAIGDALARLAIAERGATAAIGYRDRRNAYGALVGSDETEPAHRLRADRMKDWRAALEALRFDPSVTPAEIEARCADALAEADAGEPDRPARLGGRITPPRA